MNALFSFFLIFLFFKIHLVFLRTPYYNLNPIMKSLVDFMRCYWILVIWIWIKLNPVKHMRLQKIAKRNIVLCNILESNRFFWILFDSNSVYQILFWCMLEIIRSHRLCYHHRPDLKLSAFQVSTSFMKTNKNNLLFVWFFGGVIYLFKFSVTMLATAVCSLSIEIFSCV